MLYNDIIRNPKRICYYNEILLFFIIILQLRFSTQMNGISSKYQKIFIKHNKVTREYLQFALRSCLLVNPFWYEVSV